jgi:SAM-dependent methyltransferase
MPTQGFHLSIIIVTDRGFSHWPAYLSQLHSLLEGTSLRYEIWVAASQLDEKARTVIEQKGVRIIFPSREHYGTRLRAALDEVAGDYIMTLDAELGPPIDLISRLWMARETAEIVIGSRYVEGGMAAMPLGRRLLSRSSNLIFSRGLDLHVQDMSSAFRLYKSQAIKTLPLESKDYEILQEILTTALMMGYQIAEVPFQYQSDDRGFARALGFGWSYMRAFARLWKLRNSIASADYDARAYDALMPPQRYWQRQRFKIITTLIREHGSEKCLDVGCGSSRIIGALPPGSIVLDLLLRKLRYVRRFGKPAVQGSIFSLPVPNETFPCVLCSQVIEHVPRANVLDELDRVLQPGGFLILGTPDYGNWQWRVIEWLYKVLLPQAYADEHITHYTYHELVDEFVHKRGYSLESAEYILQGELILGMRKPSRG